MKSRILGIFLSLLIASNLSLVAKAGTISLSINGNGTESTNEVSVSQESQTNVQQSNQSDVNNNIEVKANTGNNSASENTGEVSIETGDATVKTEVINVINHIQTEVENCCEPPEINIDISNNGEGSDNIVKQTSSNQTQVHVQQYAKVNNSVKSTANTGGNTANKNNGQVEINTGDAVVKTNVKNTLNLASIYVSDCCQSDLVSARIKGNGPDSSNIIILDSDTSIIVTKYDTVDVNNDIEADANTGNNRADKNLDDVIINTGDAYVEIDVETIANLEDVIIGGPKPTDDDKDNDDKDDDKDDDKKDEDEKPTPKPTPTVPSEKTSGKTAASSADKDDKDDNGKVLGAADNGRVLPITGSLGMMLMLMANILMFLLGCYFRLRSGRSPDLNVAK